MSSLADFPSRDPVFSGPSHAPGKTRKLPVLNSSVPASSSPLMRDPMDSTPSASAAATSAAPPPVHSSSDPDRPGATTTTSANGSADVANMNNHAPSNQAIGAAAAAQQPKVVQTAFIHKLYKSVPPLVQIFTPLSLSLSLSLSLAVSLSLLCADDQLLTIQKYARRSHNPTFDLVVQHERQFRHVSHLRILQSPRVRWPARP